MNDSPNNAPNASATPEMPPASEQKIYWAGDCYCDRYHAAKLAEIAAGPKEYDCVFVGDSITQHWCGWSDPSDVEPLMKVHLGGDLQIFNGPGKRLWDKMANRARLLNLGLSGDTTSRVLWRIGHGEMDGYRARFVFVMIGTNNCEDTPEERAEGIRAIVAMIAEKQPEATILLSPIFPCGATPDDPLRVPREKTNEIIRGLADGKRVVWADFRRKFLNADGTISRTMMPDYLHLLEDGYRIWRDALVEYIPEIWAPEDDERRDIWIEAEDFEDKGGWTVETQFTHQMGSAYLLAAGALTPVADAKTSFEAAGGEYTLWLRTKDWEPGHHPGLFRVLIDGAAVGGVMGASGKRGWAWEKAGTVGLSKGRHTIALHDETGAYGRCDAIWLSPEADAAPEDNYAATEALRLRMAPQPPLRLMDEFDVVVVGGGPAGVCAAVAAARSGAKTALVQDRPVPGGNISDEIRGCVGGAGSAPFYPGWEEKGIIEEWTSLNEHEDKRYLFSDAAEKLLAKEKNLEVFLGERVIAAQKGGDGRIASAVSRNTLTGARTRWPGKVFIDCTGDGWLGFFAGADFRYGREAASEFGEPTDLAPAKADKCTMSGCLVGYDYVLEDKPAPFKTPDWAADMLPEGFTRNITTPDWQWWIEHPNDIDDATFAEEARDELIRYTIAYWGWVKNQSPVAKQAENARLVSFPTINGRREFHRLIGDRILTANDLLAGRMFDDRVAYGGWALDVHDPLGLKNPVSTGWGPGTSPRHPPLYSIPFACLYSRNVPNLLMAGRDISVTHLALGSTRVVATCATQGQAVGTAAAMCAKGGITPRELREKHIRELQAKLVAAGMVIPGMRALLAAEKAAKGDGCLTYANPLSIPSIPRGSDHAGCGFSGLPYPDYRSISDPSVMLHDGKWYLYPSYGMTWVSEDFVHWDYVPCNIPCEPGYSPTAVPAAGRFWMTRHSDGLYVADSPTGPFTSIGDFILPDGSSLRPVDPAFFLDDDGSLYLYWFGMEGNSVKGGRSFTLGAKLDAANPQKVLTKPVILNAFDPSHKWERFGAHGQDDRWGWIEGQWMVKHNGRYYLIYATPGTEFPQYCMAAYYSDEGPLSGFVCQKRNPVVSSAGGLVRGGGHGCIVHAPDGSLWAFYTIPMPCAHIYERRIGMDRVEVDENGELYCPGVTETPQFGPCQPRQGDTGLRPLTFFLRFSHRASSQTEGHEAFYALDDSLLTYWLPEEDDAKPTFEIDLGASYSVAASRIVWRDVGLDYAARVKAGPFRYRIEVAAESPDDEASWTTALDASDNGVDLAVDYRTFPAVTGRYVRLVVVGSPRYMKGRIRPGVVSFTAFGVRDTSGQ